MSIVKVEARTGLGELLTLTLADVSNGYLVEDIDGLDPVKATLSSTTLASMPGAKIQARRREMRNILIKLKFYPNYTFHTVRGLRTALYSFFTSETDVSLRFYMEDDLVVDIQGVVESCEAPLFTDEPGAVISIMCEEPDFVALEPIVVSQDTVDDLDEFTIHYDGSSPTGIEFAMTLDRDLTEFTIYQRPPDNVLRTFDFAAAMLDGDILEIGTIPGEKHATLTRTGVESSVLYGKPPQSQWLLLRPGDNHFRVYAVGAPIPFTITYTPLYGGL